jgi:hypothetical protein
LELVGVRLEAEERRKEGKKEVVQVLVDREK